ncbi:putative ABC transporter ATP-binding protein [Gordonia effusa NBRC 100432]|uniref:Putative ABC transporter ATP-binding protein n=1 Tax=Gordonia effusa NBRC 100432 TaxID=1077974 RepID=H0R6H9_9ACTN|nr:ATP-binding cassette domain-containing protein [Gordonia effusa]GAB20680.1 putative ABC transporter ATP-binding protein [Gordonia effusa NBRC 100432]
MIAARDLSISVAGRPLLSGVDLEVDAGEIVGLIGPSGSGKTTLGRVMVGLTPPDSGTVELDGNPLPRRPNGSVTMLFQSPRRSFDPRLRLRDAVRVCAKGPLAEDEWRRLCDLVELPGELLDRLPRQVSQGQLQRVSLVRALVSKPKFLVCDEPTSALDPLAAAAVMTALRRVTGDGTGLLIASHDVPLLVATCDRVLEIHDHSIVKKEASTS